MFLEEQGVYAPVLPGAAEALLTWGLARTFNRPVLWIGDGTQSLEERHQDLRTLDPQPHASALLYYPALEALPGAPQSSDNDITGQRLNTVLQLMHPDRRRPAVITTCVQALLQKTIASRALKDMTARLEVGAEFELDDLAEKLALTGYAFMPTVEERGQASRRGGILDLWPPSATWPHRVEFFGQEIESIRTFDPATQRSLDKLPSMALPPAGEFFADTAGDNTPTSFTEYIPAKAILVWSDRERIEEHAAIYEQTLLESGAQRLLTSLSEVERALAARPDISQVYASQEHDAHALFKSLQLEPVQGVFALPRNIMHPGALDDMRQQLTNQLLRHKREGREVIVFFDTPGARDHFEEQSSATPPSPRPTPSPRSSTVRRKSALQTEIGALSEGFGSAALGLLVVAESDISGRRKISGRRYNPLSTDNRPRPDHGPRIASLEDIDVGDYVVHIAHGVGRYLGLREIIFNGRRQEVLTIEYAAGAKLHVPVGQSHLLSRYIGVAKRQITLHRLDGRKWDADKAAAERAIVDLASQLLETQAARNLLPGHAHPLDNAWQHEFEASFPFRETVDQVTVIEEVKLDLQSTRPMDRLICGDAGYGKTEVAMRAAFKAVMGGKQVALLVPTTVLAQQHYRTFSARMEAYPVRVEMLSRFCSGAQLRRTREELASGAVDIVIGTHALLQPGITFKDLGLVIIDEEQRFGVVHKERFKELRRLVDVLTMTATPIPRTLHMSLTGARDMSLLQTPPSERMAIETIVARSSDEVIRGAMLRELNREGQVFYLHNRVMSIDLVAHRLRKLVPEARIGVAHGQMPTGELSAVMQDFVKGDFDVLLCTTIIESGVDIPRANTILIDRADRFGIADLYQLRGRVGRSHHKAYAYLLLPPGGAIDSIARERIGAVRKYSSLSAGFNLSMRDLELRGAGNLLGTAQSGHIAAIGFGLYCQLLQRTVAMMKNKPMPPLIDVDLKLTFIDLSPSAATHDNAAFIPYDYVESERDRIGIYRKLAEVGELKACRILSEELRDRFGPLPIPVQRLLRIAELRVHCHNAGIVRIEIREERVVMTRRDRSLVMHDARFPRLTTETTDVRLSELIELVTH